MGQFEIIQQKLEAFIRKYYLNELLKGGILFFTIGVLYFLITLLIEHFLWLNMLGRTMLFWLFILGAIGLFIKFICIPLAKLFKLSRGIDYTTASKMIGIHFPEVEDRLLNVLQLQSSTEQSELLLAGIAQKSAALQPVPFKLAINFKDNIKYLKYAAIPVLLFVGISLIGNKNWFTESYKRVVNYSTVYEPPAPFHFRIINQSLEALENRAYTLEITTEGDVVPDNVSIQFDEELYFMKRNSKGNFEYIFEQPKGQRTFRFKGNEVTSRPYTLDVVAVPLVQNFEMHAEYPLYTKKKKEIFRSSGNATLPEGTKVTWKIRTNNTDQMSFITADTTEFFGKIENTFTLKKRIYQDTDYELATSNKKVSNYERLAFGLKVIKDQYPELQLRSEVDSINTEYMYFLGQASDDYGLSKIQMVYYDSTNPEAKTTQILKRSQNLYEEFSYTFPDTLSLVDGKSYEFYFEVYDNDALHNYKHARSRVFSYNKTTKEERKKEQLAQQSKTLGGMDESLKKFKEQENLLKELSKTQKEKKALSYNEKKKLQNFVKRQEQQEQMMKNFTKELKENLDKLQKDEKEDDAYKEALKDRLERQEKELQKNERLLEELKKLTDKLQKEELTEKLEELGKQNKNTEKNLEQLVELTKRYYVIKKHEQLAAQLEELSKKQEALSQKKNEENTKEEQDRLNKEFEEFQKGMEELREKNSSLQKSMNLDQEKEKEKSINEEQEKASQKLGENKKEAAKNNQKNAAQKMKQMSDQMQMEMAGMEQEQQEEDAEMLRQILDNLIEYSLSQESLMERFRAMKENNPDYARSIRRQSVLREHFKHIDDSLYALALRTPEIKEEMTEKITDIELNINKSLEQLSENMLLQGASSQRYAITYANELAFMLSNALNNMQSSKSQGKPGKGKKPGDAQGFQLPDIIKKQEGINQQMKEGLKKGKDGEKGKEGDDGKEGQNGQEGDKGKKGKSGKSGEQGDAGKEGKNGKGKDGNGEGDKGGKEGKSGKNGKNGKTGKGDKEGQEGQEGEDGEEGEGNPFNSELSNGELYEIFKRQQELRQKLQDRLEKEGLGRDGNRLLRQMEQVEQELLSKGFNQSTMQKMQNIKHQLLKLDQAAFQQGEENRREGRTNYESFEAPNSRTIPDAKQYFNRTEILNRQVLPLRQVYKAKVQQYFKKNND